MKLFPGVPQYVVALVMDKAIYQTGNRALIAVRRAKIRTVVYTVWKRPAVTDSTQVQFGLVSLRLDTTRQRIKPLKIGLVDI